MIAALVQKFPQFTWLLKRVFVLYGVTILFLFLFLDLGQAVHLAKLRTLNRLRPEGFGYLIKLSNRQIDINKDKLEANELYFRRLTEYLPNRPDAYGMHGFCLYQLGDYKGAVRAYSKAIKLNPTFFWFYHNLGMAYYQLGEYKMAAEMFKGALMTTPENAVLFISLSEKIYKPILFEHQGDVNVLLKGQLKEGSFQSYMMLALSNYHLKNFKELFAVASIALKEGVDRKGAFYFLAGVGAYELKEYNQAVFMFQQAIDLDPQNADAHKYMGQALNALGQEQYGQRFLFKADLLKNDDESIFNFDKKVNLGLY